jgi:hypothetical protein
MSREQKYTAAAFGCAWLTGLMPLLIGSTLLQAVLPFCLGLAAAILLVKGVR